jgi:hypothetical protein
MPAAGDDSPDAPDRDRQRIGPDPQAQHTSHRLRIPGAARGIRVGQRLGRVLLIMGGITAAVLVAVSTNAITVPGSQDSTPSPDSNAQAALAAKRMAVDQLWASATCTNILNWKNEIHHDATSLNLGFGPVARLHDAIAATTAMSNRFNKLGLPPTAHTAQAQAEIGQLRSDIESRVHNVEGAAGGGASGNLAAVGALLNDLEADTAVGTQIVEELRHVVSVDLGLSLVETRACRQLVGIPV